MRVCKSCQTVTVKRAPLRWAACLARRWSIPMATAALQSAKNRCLRSPDHAGIRRVLRRGRSFCLRVCGCAPSAARPAKNLRPARSPDACGECTRGPEACQMEASEGSGVVRCARRAPKKSAGRAPRAGALPANDGRLTRRLRELRRRVPDSARAARRRTDRRHAARTCHALRGGSRRDGDAVHPLPAADTRLR